MKSPTYDTSVFEYILVGSSLRLDVVIKQVVGGQVYPAGWRLHGQVDINGDTAALAATVVKTIMQRLRLAVLSRVCY